jgi:hypothetical protein
MFQFKIRGKRLVFAGQRDNAYVVVSEADPLTRIYSSGLSSTVLSFDGVQEHVAERLRHYNIGCCVGMVFSDGSRIDFDEPIINSERAVRSLRSKSYRF